MKRFKKVFIAGLASLTLAVSTVGMTADAAGCGHIWTVEEKTGHTDLLTETHEVSGDIGHSQTCTITYGMDFYHTICRACGEELSTRSEITVSHSVSH